MPKKTKSPRLVSRLAWAMVIAVMPISLMAGQHNHSHNQRGIHGHRSRILDSYQSKPVLVAFLGMVPATGSNPSAQETVFLSSLNQQYALRGLAVVGVDASGLFDHRVISSTELAKTAADWHLNFPLLEDPQSALAQQFKIQSLPTILLLDDSGKVVKSWQGYTRPAALAQGIETLLGGPLSELPDIAP